MSEASATAGTFSDPARGGTGRHELMVWWIPYGRGRALTCLLGHLWPNQPETAALRLPLATPPAWIYLAAPFQPVSSTALRNAADLGGVRC